jgi:hypothetical protein
MGNLTFGIPVSSTTTVGAGLGLQRMWVAGDLFRDVTTWSINASLGQPDGGVWVADMSFANNRHPSTYIDMNSRVLSVSLHRRQPLAWLGIEAVEMGVGYDREIILKTVVEELKSAGKSGRLRAHCQTEGSPNG